MAIKDSTDNRAGRPARDLNGFGGHAGSSVFESSPGALLRASAGTATFEDETQSIPDIVIRRLPIYVRTLKALSDRDVQSVSSDELAELIGVTAAQIRRDLSYFGKFGKQGKGYDTAFLGKAISRILKLDRQWPVALAGMGKLGHAIANYRGFSPSSFSIVSCFDRNPEKAGSWVNEMEIRPVSELSETIAREGIKIGIIATPKIHAQETAELMVAGGVEAILNYAPVILKVPEHVTVREIDPVSALQSMTYYIDRN
jgi:redox-sensing transcriptional repressor